MHPNGIGSILDQLTAATDRLFASTERADLDAAEAALAQREAAVRQLSEVVALGELKFSSDDLQALCACEARGRRAIEMLMERRREGWVKASQLSTQQHILQSFQ